MRWHALSGAGAGSHAWFRLRAPGGLSPRRVTLEDGILLGDVLRQDGPAGHDVWFEQMPDSGGRTLTDMLWDTSASGVKVVSDRLADLLGSMDGDSRVVPFEVKDRRGGRVPGYVALVESLDPGSPVHSFKSRTRGSKLVISDEVADAVRAARFTGLKLRGVDSPFPGDQPL